MNSSKLFQLRLFGSPLLSRVDGTQVSGPAIQRHRMALLALLALAPDCCVSRDKLMSLLWPESDTEHARQLLNQAVYQLRKALGDNAIVSVGDELRLDTTAVHVDVVHFETALAAHAPADAVKLYQGPLLDGFFLSDAPEFEQWLERERTRLADAYAQALEKLAEEAAAAGDLPHAAEWWKTRAAHDPYDSRIALRLLEALAAAGNRAAAVQYAEQHTRTLAQEFGIDPPADIASFVERLRVSPPPPPKQTPAAGPPPLTANTDEVVAPRPVRKRLPRYAYALALLAVVLAATTALPAWRDYADRRWLMREALPRIEAHLDVADWEAAYTLARRAQARVPDSPELAELWTRMSWLVSIHSKPEGARVLRQAYDAQGGGWEDLGRTPLVGVRFPYGLSKLRLEKEGYRPLVRALGGAHINWTELKKLPTYDGLLVGPDTFLLDTEKTLPARMVRVPGWTLVDRRDTIALRDFFIGQFEVTNAEYKAFVEAGGYQQPRFWDPIVIAGDTVPFSQAMTRFVDRTGRAGPSTWEAGDFAAGEAEFPVTGVSWYEAAAYARFAKRELPTAHHWQQALANAMFPWLLPASNFGSRGPRAVTASRALSYVAAFDLAGNVREWTATAIDNERIILGGSSNDPYYVAGLTDSSAPPEDRSPGNGFRVALTFDDGAAAARARARMVNRSTTASPVLQQVPVADAVYAAYSRVFDYDRAPLDAVVERADTTRVWIRERVRFTAGYADERVLLHLYLPTHGRAPYQTVVYWPGWDTFWLNNADEYFAKQLDFIVKSGRAVAFPIYRGIFERKVGNQQRRADFGTAEYRDNTIHTVKDLRRTVDYLATRADIDTSAIGFYGYSWGGVNGPVALAQEPRLRVAVIQIGLLPPMSATPEVDPVNALPRVRVPTLLFSGEFDAMVPTQNSNRYFSLLGARAQDKRHVIAIGGHFIPRPLVIRETLDWLDRYLGPVTPPPSEARSRTRGSVP